MIDNNIEYGDSTGSVKIENGDYASSVSARGIGASDKVTIEYLDNVVWIHAIDEEGNTTSVPFHREVAAEFFKAIQS